MTDKIFASYDLDSGTAAARPATPTVSDGRLYIYVATDTHAISIWDGSQWVGGGTLPTRQTFITGTAATYTTPTGCRQLRIRFVGGGGGGSGSGVSDGSNGVDGADTIFNSIHATGGKKGLGGASGAGGIGGTAGSGTADLRIDGQHARGGAFNLFTGQFSLGGWGGSSKLGFGGDQNTAAPANSGGGGGGGSAGGTINVQAGGGGGGAEYVELIINNPAANYTYTVGAKGTGGAAGTSGNPGSDGAVGIIVVDEYY